LKSSYDLFPNSRRPLLTLSQNDKALFSRVGRPSKFDYSVTFKETQEMQLLRQRLLKTRTIIETNLRTVESLCGIFKNLTPPRRSLSPSHRASKHQELTSELVNLIHRYKSHRLSIIRLLDIADGTMTLLLKILDYRHDENIRANISATRDLLSAAEHETVVLNLIARQTQQDSRSMKIITFIALIYLPGTLVASVYSSPIIEGFDHSKQILSFLLVTVFLTVITVSGAVLWDKGYWKKWRGRIRAGASP
jgi:Mg2+ and Co2+ transporter CorA